MSFYIKRESKFCVIEKSATALNMLSFAKFLKDKKQIQFSTEVEQALTRLHNVGQWSTKPYHVFNLNMLSYRAMSSQKQKAQCYTLEQVKENFTQLKSFIHDYQIVILHVLKHKKIIEKITCLEFKAYFDYEKELNVFLLESKRKQLRVSQTEFNKSLIVDIISLASWKKNKIQNLYQHWQTILNAKGEPNYIEYEVVKNEIKKEISISVDEIEVVQKIIALSQDMVLRQKLIEFLSQHSQDDVCV